MNEKEIAEIRRRFRPDKSNITSVRGCYVNEKHEIISEFNQSLHTTAQEETENILSILKKTLSGTISKNLLDIAFDTKQVVDGDEHKLLMSLRNSSLGDEESVRKFFRLAIDSISIEGNYLILLTHDKYDVSYRSNDGEKQNDASSEVFSYILCSICPVKMTKPELSYYFTENQFHNRTADYVVASPELGFMFPTFDDRSSNIYNALYYSKDTMGNHKEFVDAVFHTELPMPATVQKETFETILGETLAEACSYEVVQSINNQLREKIIEHKVNKEIEPLMISKETVKNVLKSCGVSENHVIAFEEKYDTEFGVNATLSPRNIVDTKQVEVRTPDVVIHVNPERGSLVETRVIDGVKYILIRADEDIEVNGVSIHIS